MRKASDVFVVVLGLRPNRAAMPDDVPGYADSGHNQRHRAAYIEGIQNKHAVKDSKSHAPGADPSGGNAGRRLLRGRICG